MNGKPPVLQDELLAQHICGPICNNYAISYMITFKHREFLRNNFGRLFADKILDKKIFSSYSVVAKPDPKASVNPALSQIKLATSKRVEEIIREKAVKCDKCGQIIV